MFFIVADIDGGWGIWDSYSKCSNTCGNGVRTRSRKCDKPIPQNGGSYCSGLSYESETCKIKECPG